MLVGVIRPSKARYSEGTMAFRGLLLAFLWCGLVVADAGKPTRVYYSANRHGEAEPCGCAVEQLGGLDRYFNLLQREAENVSTRFLVDAGDAFFAAPEMPESRRDQERAKARVIAEGYAKLGVDAFLPGRRDFAQGLAFLTELRKISGAHFVAANLVDKNGAPLFEPQVVLTRDGKKIGVTGLADPKSMEGVADVVVNDPLPALKKALAALRLEKPDEILVLSQLGTPVDKTLTDIQGVSLIVGARSLDALQNPEVNLFAWVVQPPIQGQSVGWVDLGVDRKHKLVSLDKGYDGKNAISALIEKYKEQVRQLAFSQSEKAIAVGSDKPFVADSQTCRGCHPKQYDWWAKTNHASAYLVLYAKNQHFDPECISCHSLGFEQPGGFAKIARPWELKGDTKKGKPEIEAVMKRVFAQDGPRHALDSRIEPERYAALKTRYHDQIHKLEKSGRLKRNFIGVQCEHCHGNRSGHPNPAVPTVKKVVATACTACHVPPHDNAFDFDAKVKIVGCPLSEANH